MISREFLECRKGAAAAELALLLPLMVVILFGMFEGGYFLYNEHKVVKGVRDGARYAARQPFSKFVCGGGTTLSDTALETSIENLTRSGYPSGDNPTVIGADNPTIPGWDNSEVTVTYTCNGATNTGLYTDISGGAPIVTVSANVPYMPLFGVIGFDTSSLSLKADSQAAVMGL
ncbi:TadE/TadG family type IV pilus assembly protein [Altererythrobacter sp. MF3-039]|uniref:TadE/TadG family type IV pilus assembly protein n=1 Tax=Altererythrobacter sp. MF3-039 TaxID=3252901 RepID=UPI00390CAA77